MRIGNQDNQELVQEAMQYLPSLYRFAMSLVRRPGDAEDLVQETYLRAFRSAWSLRPESNIRNWLFTILHNIWRNERRHQASGPTFIAIDGNEELPVESRERDASPYLTLVRKDEQNEVRRALESLPARYREMIILRDLEGFSYQEIAGILDCPAGTVMSRLARAREQLREEVMGRRALASRR